MTLPVLCFIFGGLLVLLSLGVDAEAMGFKVPRIAGIYRLFALVGGLAFIALPILRPSTFEHPANVFIYEELGDTQDSETLEVHINGGYAGSITLERPKWRNILVVPVGARDSHYTLDGHATETVNKKTSRVTSGGEGTIDLIEPAVYAVETEGFSNGNYSLALKKLQ